VKQLPVFEFNLAESFPRLAAAPIVEAVIHWVARPTKPFQREDLQKKLAERLPDYPDPQPQQQLQLETRFGPDGSTTQTRHESWQGFRLTSLDKRYVVQFTREGMVFSRLAPYESWDAFSAEGKRLWRIFIELAEPSEVERLGIRFINRVLPVERTKVDRYLAKPPKCLEPLGFPVNGFLYQSIHDVPGHPLQIHVVQTTQPPLTFQSDGFGLILDIGVVTTQAFQTADETLEQYLAKMRWLKNKAFFSLLSKSLIRSFEKGNP